MTDARGPWRIYLGNGPDDKTRPGWDGWPSRRKAILYGYAMLLASFAEDGKGIYPTLPALAARFGCSVKTARRERDRLIGLGLFEVAGHAAPGQPILNIAYPPMMRDKFVPAEGQVWETEEVTIKVTSDIQGDKFVPTQPRRQEEVIQAGDKFVPETEHAKHVRDFRASGGASKSECWQANKACTACEELALAEDDPWIKSDIEAYHAERAAA